MGLLNSLLGKSESASSSQPAAPDFMHHSDNVSLKYDPDLIPQLKQEHNALLRLFGEIKQSHASNDFMALKRALQKFQMTLSLHLAMENSSFYSYLRMHLSKNSEQHNTMIAFWDDMQTTGQVVAQFLKKYNHADFTPEMQSSFGYELEAIGTALASRIKREEESLFGLYFPSRA